MTELGRQIGDLAQALSVSGLCEVGPDGVTCIVADRPHREIYHSGSTLGDVATTLQNAEPQPLARVDDVITEGPIPANVTDMADQDNPDGSWPRWVRHDTADVWDYHTRDDVAARWRVAPGSRGRTGEEIASHGKQGGWYPFRVLAVREPKPAAEPLAGDVGPHPYERGPYQVDGSQACGLCGARRAASIHRQAAEPQPEADLLDLITQYGSKWFASGMAAQRGSAPDQKHAEWESNALLRRIEAEVQRLHDNAAKDDVLIKVLAKRGAEALAEVERLKAAAPQPDGGLVLTLPEVPEGAVGERAHDEYDVPLFIHACGSVLPESVGGHPVKGVTSGEHHCYPPCKKPGPWRPLYVLAPPREPRTAAEIWRDMPPGARDVIGWIPAELVEALDREAGL